MNVVVDDRNISMTEFVLVSSMALSTLFSFIFVKLRVHVGISIISVPVATIVIVFFMLQINYTISQMGPFIVVTFAMAYVLSIIVSFLIYLRSLSVK